MYACVHYCVCVCVCVCVCRQRGHSVQSQHSGHHANGPAHEADGHGVPPLSAQSTCAADCRDQGVL